MSLENPSHHSAVFFFREITTDLDRWHSRMRLAGANGVATSGEGGGLHDRSTTAATTALVSLRPRG